MYKATDKFKELSIMNNYQGLSHLDFRAFRAGKEVDLKKPPKHLIDGGYIEKVKATKEKK